MISTKHLLNSIQSSVRDNLLGLVYNNNDLQFIPESDSVVRKDFRNYRQKGKVLLISGGGAGHEPMFSGFVGEGMLTAVVSGDIFASPPPRKTLKLIETIAEKDGNNEILIIIANYTGDRLNFGIAREHALLKGYKIDLFIFGDDIAFYGEGKRTGRRGIAGISLAHKIAGALAEEGHSLKYLKDILTEYSRLIGTISISLTSCNIPDHGSSFTLAADEIELGLGAHGEAGVQRLKLCTAHEVVKVMLHNLVGQSSLLREPINKHNNRIVVLVNNMGGLSQFELNIIINETVTQLQALNISVERLYCGTFMTSFSMSGVSITAMAVSERILQLLDRPSSSGSWNQLLNVPKVVNRSVFLENHGLISNEKTIDFESIDGLKFGNELFLRSIELSCKALISSEKYLNDLDTELGDGDCGSTLSTISKHFLKLISDKELKPSFFQMSQICENNMGGTSGAIYSLMLTAASQSVRANQQRIGQNSYDCIDFWTDIMKYSLETITLYSSAKPGDRSMLDSLHSAFQALVDCDHSLPYHQIANSVAMSANRGAENTASMNASVGRASYVNLIPITRPDPGAVAVSIWFDAIAQAVHEFYNNK